MLSLALAGSFSEALVLSLSFAVGNLIAIAILNEIRRRSNLERVPRWLKGNPLLFISMGLLALISASAAGILFRILEVL
jgi:electron transport complex protein RnfA